MLQYTAYLCDAVLVYVYAIVLSFLLLVFWKVLGGCITADSCGLSYRFHRSGLDIYQKFPILRIELESILLTKDFRLAKRCNSVSVRDCSMRRSFLTPVTPLEK